MAFLKPCARCYRARNFIKDGMGRIFQKPATHTIYTTELGEVMVHNATHKIVGVPYEYRDYHGNEVHASKGRLIDVNTGETISTYKRRKRVHYP